jgi:dethiobiotin synthetase
MTPQYPHRGLFIVGTDTDVGKTYVGSLIARKLVRQGIKVGVYKPVASGCSRKQQELVADDAVHLWEAAGRPANLEQVCPQRFAAPLAPHAAAAKEGKVVDDTLLREGLENWANQCEFVIVEGAGGLLSPISAKLNVADLAIEFEYPLVIVARNRLGVVNQTQQTILAAQHYGSGLSIAGVVLNDRHSDPDDLSLETNWGDLRDRCQVPMLDHIRHGSTGLNPDVDWEEFAKPTGRKHSNSSKRSL